MVILLAVPNLSVWHNDLTLLYCYFLVATIHVAYSQCLSSKDQGNMGVPVSLTISLQECKQQGIRSLSEPWQMDYCICHHT